jgi:hypothetical protein
MDILYKEFINFQLVCMGYCKLVTARINVAYLSRAWKCLIMNDSYWQCSNIKQFRINP